MVLNLEFCPNGVHSGAEGLGVPRWIWWWRGRTSAPTALPLLVPHGRKGLHHALIRPNMFQLVPHQLHRTSHNPSSLFAICTTHRAFPQNQGFHACPWQQQQQQQQLVTSIAEGAYLTPVEDMFHASIHLQLAAASFLKGP